MTISALTGAGVQRLMPAVVAADAAWNKRIPDAAPQPLPRRQRRSGIRRRWCGGRRLKLRYVTQVNMRPPTFALFASKPGELPDSYRRYLINLLREAFDLPGVPIRMMLRKGRNPYAEAK